MPNNIYIGYGLMLQGKINEALEVFRKEHDSCKARFDAGKKGKGRFDFLVLKDVLVSEGYLLYVLGIDFWMKGKKEGAEKSFRDSFDVLSRAYERNKHEAMPSLIEHLLSELRRGNKPPDMDSQLKFINEWQEKHKKEEGEEKEKPAELGKELLSKVSSIESSIEKLMKPEVIKKVAAKKEEEKEEYVVFLPRPKGIKAIIDKKTKTENQVHRKYSTRREKFDIFIYEQNVYKKVIDEGKPKMISLNPSISFRGLLILFLKYKDVALPYVELYHKAFCGTTEHNTKAEEPGDVMNTLKNAVNELKREFKYIKAFDIPRAKNSTYKCEGDFDFCLILKRPTNGHYTMLFKKKFKFTESIPEEV